MGTKLLLADDSITIQKVVGIIFAGEEYQLTIVDNGDAALAKARETRPDVLLVDAVMPGRTGYEVCEEIRRDPALTGVPILLLTGAFEPFDEDKARRSGADDFISKPFESQHLIDKVTSLAELGKQRRSAAPAPSPAVAPPPPVIEKSVQPPSPQPHPFAAPPVPLPLAEAAPADTAQFTVEIVESTPDDDLWGAFELEEVAEGETDAFGEASFTGEAPFVAEVIEEPFSFVEEPETAGQPAGFAPQWEPVEEETYVFEEEADAGAFEIIPEERFDVFEEDTKIFEAGPNASGEFFAEEAEPAVSEFALETTTAPPVEQELELQFAPEEEYVPVLEAMTTAATPAVAAPAPAMGEPSLSEEQLAALVSRISRDILEKIAWEVVPDLAERIIREEIRKIKEG